VDSYYPVCSVDRRGYSVFCPLIPNQGQYSAKRCICFQGRTEKHLWTCGIIKAGEFLKEEQDMEQKRTKEEYKKWSQQQAPKSPKFKNSVMAFLVGGVICTIGQLIMRALLDTGMSKNDASSLTTLFMIFLGAFLTALNVYDDIGRIGGAGAAIPVTGFANSIVSPAMEYKREGYVMGVGARMFLIAGPVLVYGIFSSIIAGIIYYLIKS